MLTSEQAIARAFEYIKGLPENALGEDSDPPRLETVQLFDKDWIVVLSFLVHPKLDPALSKDAIYSVMSTYRMFKELTIDGLTGAVTSIVDPSAPVLSRRQANG